ncbi:MAG: cytochrome c biogenesis protein ResB [Bacillota bacterium]|nr:cytochrome c biogenesis protein ResB [Bacillota bacterium]MDW7685120.1 cytochrome c biogenesis protein ResB [Bacillota bacterium]
MAKETPGIPEHQATPESPIKQILTFLGSMQLGIILLLLLAVISVFATTQEMNLAIENVYRSWWFVGIMAFTALNLLLCTVDRIGPLTRQALHPSRVKSADAIKKMQITSSVKLKNAGEEPLADAEKIFRSNGLQTTVSETPEGPVLFGEKGKFGYFGSIVTHLSLLLILLGAMYGGLTGFEDRNGGIAGDSFIIPGSYRVEITDVEMELLDDPTVRPRVYSDVVVTKNGEEVTTGKVAINEPMRFDGVSIYHSTFLYISEIQLTDVETGEQETGKFFEGQELYVDNQGSYIQLMQFFPNFSMRPDGSPYSKNYNPENPVMAGILVVGGQRAGTVFLTEGKPELIETADGPVEVVMTGFENAAVYSIAKNLGRPYLFIGSILMVLGLYMSFFLFPRRFWAVYDEKKSMLHIGGRGYRNRLGVEQIMEKMESEILSREEE